MQQTNWAINLSNAFKIRLFIVGLFYFEGSGQRVIIKD